MASDPNAFVPSLSGTIESLKVMSPVPDLLLILFVLISSITNGLTVDSISPTNPSDLVIDVSAHLIPTANVTYSLGSTTNQWHSAHIGPGSLLSDGHKVLGSDATGQIDITTDDDQNLNISAGANGTTGDITIFSAGATTSLNDISSIYICECCCSSI